MDLNSYLQRHDGPEIFLVGPFYKREISLTKEPTIYVDRGANYRTGTDGFTIGDGDSSNVELDQLLNPQKDYSDLSFVLKNLPDKFSLIHLYGFLGGRKDHEIMNLAEVHSCLKRSKTPKTVFLDKEVTVYSAGRWTLFIEGLFSLFAFETTKTTLTGKCKYKIENTSTLNPLSSHGLSNLGRGEINLACDNPIVLFSFPP